jgi:hypothetical protein
MRGAQGDGSGVAASDLVGEDDQQEVLVGHRLLAGEREAVGQRVEQAAELEPAQRRLELRCDDVGGHRAPPRSAGTSGSGRCRA